MPVEAFWWIGFATGIVGLSLSIWALLIRGRARGRLRCPRCWYDMAGAVADDAGAHTCPE